MLKLEVKKFTSKMLGANTYLLYSSGRGIIVDPCTKVNIVEEFCLNNNIEVNLIVLTHSHIDHTLYLQEYTQVFNSEFAIHTEGNRYNMSPELNGARLFGMKKSFGSAHILLNDNDKLYAGDIELTVISTPGHSPGSICLYGENVLISGDTLFNMSIGRSDLPGGSQNQLNSSLQKLMELPDDTIVYPGHGTFSTIHFEREQNPYISL